MSGRYRIERLIGEGGSAEVFAASVVGAGGFVRRVALKRLKAELARDPAMIAEFEAEARLASCLHHANVVAVLDYGTLDGLPFQILEHVDGLDLLGLEALARAARRPAVPALWVAIAAEAAHGLEYVHHARDDAGRPLGLVHRDVTPSNVLVSWSGDVKLADFGIALSAETRAPTRVGLIKGKLEYLSPEQLRGEPADRRADVFALGCVLHRMLSGRGLMEDEVTRRRVAAGEAPSIASNVPAELGRLIAEATAPDPARRLASAAAFAEACARWLADHGAIDGRLVVRDSMLTLRPAADDPAAPPTQVAPPVTRADRPIDAPPEPTVDVTTPEPDDSATSDNTASASSGAPSAAAIEDPSGTAVEAPIGAAVEAPIGAAEISRDSAEPPTHLMSEQPLRALPYEIVASIAEGGFAEVYRARHRQTGELVALKILRDELRDHRVAPQRLEREVKLLERLRSPYLVRLLDAGRLGDGRPWLAMELLQGRTLAEEITAARGPLAPSRIRRLSRDLALGLAALHEAGIVHRDVSARNVMVVSSGGREKAMIIDLGHARWNDGRAHTELTRPGLMLGNARWMAPEQIHASSAVGAGADLYSLGLLMTAMCTGRPPFVGSPRSVLEQQLSAPVPVPPGPFAALIGRLVEKDPARRLSSAATVAAELTELDVSAERPARREDTRDVAADAARTVARPHAAASPAPSRRAPSPGGRGPAWAAGAVALALAAWAVLHLLR